MLIVRRPRGASTSPLRWAAIRAAGLALVGLALAGCNGAGSTAPAPTAAAVSPSPAPTTATPLAQARTPTAAPPPPSTPSPAVASPAVVAPATATRPAATATAAISPTAPAPTPRPATPTAAATARPIAFVRDGDLWTVDPRSPDAVEQLTRRGDVRDVAWSPDGRQIAYTAGPGNQSEIYVHDLATGADRRLTDNRVFDGEPDWSPDSRTIVFSRGDLAGDETADAALYLTGEVWRIEADGADARRLTAGRSPAWAPDGRRIAFVSNGGPRGPDRLPAANDLRLINGEGRNEWTVLRPADFPRTIDLSGAGAVFAPSARTIGTPVWNGGGHVITVRVWGGLGLVASISDQQRDLTIVAGIHEGSAGRLTARPGGDRVAFEVLGPSGVPSVEIARFDAPVTDRQDRVTIGGPRAAGPATYPAWSPDGRQIAVISGDEPARTIVVHDLAGRPVARLASGAITALAWR